MATGHLTRSIEKNQHSVRMDRHHAGEHDGRAESAATVRWYHALVSQRLGASVGHHALECPVALLQTHQLKDQSQRSRWECAHSRVVTQAHVHRGRRGPAARLPRTLSVVPSWGSVQTPAADSNGVRHDRRATALPMAHLTHTSRTPHAHAHPNVCARVDTDASMIVSTHDGCSLGLHPPRVQESVQTSN